MRTRRGRFIVLEGIDGSGTTTQAALAAEHLRARGVQVHLTREPSDGPVGMLVRAVLSGRLRSAGGPPFDRRSLALLFAADRLDHITSEVGPRLAAGVTVVSDRYVYSSLAYQSQDCPPSWVKELNRLAPAPDLCVFLRLPARAAEKRLRSSRQSRDIFEEIVFQRRVAASYARAVRAVPRGRLLVVDGALPKERVFGAIRTRLDALM
ncbi:MAG: dTMP kinase [Deltaproteobacteria bacterium]|nr:dTMP kinase [Deltaproteobacteria bacterium]